MGYLPISSLVERIPIKERVDIRNVKTKSDKIIRISPEEKRNLMNGILHGIERDKVRKPVKRKSWNIMTNEEIDMNNKKPTSTENDLMT